MPVDCQRQTCGGKGNLGKFLDRNPQICAAGLPTQQPNDSVGGALSHYLLKDAADALISDAIKPEETPRPLPPLRNPVPRDTRFAGKYGDAPELINPPDKSNLQMLIDEFKNTVYSSFWKKPLGTVPDSKPNVPKGFDYYQTFGKKMPHEGSLYDLITPKVPYPDATPESEKPGVQKKYVLCEPPFNSDLTYGCRTVADNRGIHAKCALTDDRVKQGNDSRVVMTTCQSDFKDTHQARLGQVLAPHNNINSVPNGYTFGKLYPPEHLPEVLAHFPLNPDRDYFLKCLGHLNYLRRSLSRRFLPTFFHDFYLKLKYLDMEKSHWLPKKVVYDNCAKRFIEFNDSLIEHLLSMWEAFDGSNINYKIFNNVINYRKPLPEIQKVIDFPPECLDFGTTYTEMIKTVQEPDNSRSPMAGLPSGRYFDNDYPVTPRFGCLADRSYLPGENDMKSCLYPSILTSMHVNHRHMYAVREPEVVRRVFEASGEIFSDESFDIVWEKAKKLHPKGWVSYETFRRALECKHKKDK